MLSISHDPFVHDAFERLFVPLFGTAGAVTQAAPRARLERIATRQLELRQSESGWTLRADLPGIDPDSVDLEVSEHEISITIDATNDAPEGMRRVAGERETAKVTRRWRVRRAIDVDSAQLSFDKGQLRLELSARERQAARKIKLKPASEEAQS